MKTYKLFSIAMVLTVLTLTNNALAAPVIDGTADAEYGSALSTQNTKTHFGDSKVGDLVYTGDFDSMNNLIGGGSEIDQVFGVVSGGRLYVTIAGNLENNFNKLEVFIDSTAGGQNTIDKTFLPAGVDSFSGGALEGQNGLTFDTGFDADYYLTFTHGGENHNGGGFWAITAHYAELNNGTAGRNVAAGMQLAPQGLPQVLRGPLQPDFNSDFDVDGVDFLTWQRNLGATPADKSVGDANDDDVVSGADLDIWKGRFGTERGLNDFAYNPTKEGGIATTNLLGPTLPGLNQGELIDSTYATANPVAPELDFANARGMSNDIDLRMALDNSNIAGVEGGGAAPWETAGNPGDVVTGVEFSIPLSEIGNAAGPIKVFAFVNSNSHNYASNQFSGEGIVDANLGGNGFGGGDPNGGLGGVNMNDFTGDQFVTIPNPAVAAAAAIPEPSSALLAGCALAAGMAVRRRR
jgi:hypothetical protein